MSPINSFTPDLLSWNRNAEGIDHASRQPTKIMTNTVSFQAFEAAALARGFDEIQARSWTSDAVVDSHVHPFAVEALVVQGEMWLTVGDDTRHLLPGDTFELNREQAHSERYGTEGATYWAARRHAKPVVPR